jgi:DNA-binding response OmpR family regulator
VVDDERIITDSLVTILNREVDAFLALGCYTAAEAISLCTGIRPDLVLLDVLMPNAKGLEHALEIRDKCGYRVLLMSGQPITAELLAELERRRLRPFEIVAKPAHPLELIRRIRTLCGAEPDL